MPSDQSSKRDFPRPEIIYQPTVFARDLMIEKWPHLHKVIASGDHIAAAFQVTRRNPAWLEDPRLRDIPRATADEILDLYNHVIEDGRHIEDFLKSPREVAHRLGRRLGDDAVAVLGATHQGIERENLGVAIVGVAVVVAIAAGVTAIASSGGPVSNPPGDGGAGDAGGAGDHPQIIIDESGRVKLGSRSGA